MWVGNTYLKFAFRHVLVAGAGKGAHKTQLTERQDKFTPRYGAKLRQLDRLAYDKLNPVNLGQGFMK